MKARVWLLLSLFTTGVTWLYVSRVLGPWEHYVDVEHGILKAQMGDLYPRWVGTRELLLHGRNPYGPEVSHEIQMAYYGHGVEQKYGEGEIVLDEQRFVYPVYVVFLLAPTVYMDFPQLQVWAALVFALLTAISVFLWMDVLRWRPPSALAAAIVLFVLCSPQIVQGLRLRQMGLAVGFLLALSAWCVVRNHLVLAGIALALSTVKPQMMVLPLAWFLLWSVGAWPKRWPLLAGFAGALITLVALGQFILPGWIRFFLEGLAAYRKYIPMSSLLRVALGDWVGIVVSGIGVCGLLLWAWLNRRADAVSPEFAQTLAACFVGASLALPLVPPFNQVLLLLPVLMIARDWTSQPGAIRRFLSLVAPWPWMAYLALLLIRPRLDSPNRFPLLPAAIVLFLPFFLALMLAIRWSKGNSTPAPAMDLRLS